LSEVTTDLDINNLQLLKKEVETNFEEEDQMK
jgi:hypothetical protein